METSASFERLQHLAERQYGVFTVQQAAAAGVAEETLEALRIQGELRRLVEGAYKLRSIEGDHGEAYALWLLIYPDMPAELRKFPESGVLSHKSAADWLDSFEFDGADISVTLPVGAEPPLIAEANASRVRFYTAKLSVDEWRIHRGVPVTTPARIVADLLDEEDEDTTAIGRRLVGLELAGVVDSETLAEELDGYARRKEWGSGTRLVRFLREAARPDSEWKLNGAR